MIGEIIVFLVESSRESKTSHSVLLQCAYFPANSIVFCLGASPLKISDLS